LLGVLAEYWKGLHVYRSDGIKLRPRVEASTLPTGTWWRRLLANTVYNPQIRVAITYEPAGNYPLAELKDKVLSYLPKDDDILTQFISAEDIRRLLARAESFSDVVDVARAIDGQHEVDSAFEAKLKSLGVLDYEADDDT
jgi:hypothetical protein